MKQSIGALWTKQSKGGTTYYSGNIEIDGKKISIVAFNNKKTQDKQPDIKIYLSEEKTGEVNWG